MNTIFALASGRGKTGVSVIRISGEDAFKALQIFGVRKKLSSRYASLAKLFDPQDNSLIDNALILKFDSPSSFTGEDVVEIHCHGSIAVVNRIISILNKDKNFRLAEAGEFSKRSFENGKMDLLQAEGLADLIEAETEIQAKQALRQLEGENSKIFEEWREQIIKIQAFTEAYVDFPDEDIPDDLDKQSKNEVQILIDNINSSLCDRRGERLREGVNCAIIGKANSGKSTLINFLSKREVSIVSDIEGTTRDSIESHLDINGYPVTLIDTAGLRETEDIIEQKGVAKAIEKASSADILIIIIDATNIENNAENIQELKDIANENSLILINKTDLMEQDYIDELEKYIQDNLTHNSVIQLSLKQDDNSELIITKLTQLLENISVGSESNLITRERHRKNLEDCRANLESYIERDDLPIELKAEILRKASYSLGKIIGKVDVEDILDKIFSEFCIGK
jgi:tRNA modification GTPase